MSGKVSSSFQGEATFFYRKDWILEHFLTHFVLYSGCPNPSEPVPGQHVVTWSPSHPSRVLQNHYMATLTTAIDVKSRELCGHCTTSLQNFFRIFNLVKDTLNGLIALIHCIELGWTQTHIFLASRHKISIMFIFPPRPPHCPKAVRKRLDNKNDATCEICVNALRSLLVGEWVDSAHVTTK